MKRRQFLTASAGFVACFAGCSAEGEDENSGTSETQDPEDTPTETDTPTVDETRTADETPTAEDTPESTRTSSVTGYQIRVDYEGEWSGSISAGGSSRSIDGSGTETVDVEGDAMIVSANAQKEDDSSDELVVEILEDGEVIASESTSAEYGVAQVTSESSGGESGGGESGATFEVRIEYDGEWSGSVGGDGAVRSVDGSGTETLEIEGAPDTVTANAQKQDDSDDELTVQILKDGEVVEETSTTAEYGVAQATHSEF